MSQTESSPIPTSDNKASALVLPAFGKTPELTLGLNCLKEAESRLIESKLVNPVTYVDLEHCFNEAYRELKRHISTIGYQIALAEKALETAKSDILLDKYPEFMKDKPKTQDNADLRKAYFMRDPDYLLALDRINMLKAMESFVDGRIKVMERVCAYMKKQIDLVLRSGLTNSNLYVTSGRN